MLSIALQQVCVDDVVGRLIWNKMVILLSLAINVIMLVTWDARASFLSIKQVNGTEVLPEDIGE